MSPTPANKPYKPGTVKLINVLNFMCHESFEMELGPGVNFVIGPNGSGKSAILTALVVVLGGRATTTSRARKNSDFVMYGKRCAKITVVIHNYDKVMEKEKGFKPDEYGRSIIIEKIIYKDDTASKLTLKNDNNRKVSERKQELDEMLDHFGIIINNPICILNQEVSKTFLHSKRPEDKFDLFMKATNLEQIEGDYNAAKNELSDWEQSNNRGSIAFKTLDNEYNTCRERTKELQNRARFNEQDGELNLELFWALIRDDEDKCSKLQNQITENKKKILESNDLKEERHNKLKTYEEDIIVMTANIQTTRSNLDEAKQKNRHLLTKRSELNARHIAKKSEVDKCERELNRLMNDKSDLEKSINETKLSLKEQNSLDQVSDKRKIKIETLEKSIEELRERESKLRAESGQLNSTMTNSRAEYLRVTSKVNDLKSRLTRTVNDYNRAINGQRDELRKYGDNYVKVNELINQGEFKYKPIGPLGYHIKLKTHDVSKPLEVHLGRNAFAYICDNNSDMTKLSRIFDKVNINSRDFLKPMILTRSFTKRLDTDRYRAAHPKHKTLLDHLDIENDAVYNALVDRCSLESVLYIPDYNEAQHMLLTEQLIPKNTRCAYTQDCSVMYPVNSRSGYRSYANDTSRLGLFARSNAAMIRELQLEIRSLEPDMKDAEECSKRTNEQLQKQRKVYNEINIEIHNISNSLRQKTDELLNLKLILPTPEPNELRGLEEDLENIIENITEKSMKLESLNSELTIINKDVLDLDKEKKESEELIQNRQNELSKVNKQKADTEESKRKAEQFIVTDERHIQRLEKEQVELNAEWNKTLETMEKNKHISPGPRPNSLRDVVTIQNDIARVKASIRALQEDERDPEEVLRNLNKRMREIENMTNLKDLNLKNAKDASKSLLDRTVGFHNLLRTTISAVATTFSSVMRSMEMNGALQIYIDPVTTNKGEVIKKAKTLEIRVDTNFTPSQRVGSVMSDANHNLGGDVPSTDGRRACQSQPAVGPNRPKRARSDRHNKENADSDSANEEPVTEQPSIQMTDARSLSGGERSFSTVAFVLSLWQHCASPFKLMDEIDVFMDMVTRRISYNALIRFAQCAENPGQFIFFSPLELPKFDMNGSDVKVFEMPTIVRKDQSTKDHNNRQSS